MATIGVYNITSSSFTCCVYDLDTSYLQDDRYIEWYIGDSNWNYVAGPLTSFLGAGVSSGGDCLVDGLSSNTSYMVEALIYYNNGSNYVRLETSVTTSGGQGRPDKFSWTTGKDISFSGLLSKVSGTAFDLTATEWNGLCNNVNLVSAYATGRTYNFTTAYKGNPFYASMYNEVANAIRAITNYSVTLPTVSPGDSIKADDLNQLMYAINSVT